MRSNAAEAQALQDSFTHESVVVRRGARTRWPIAVALHSTAVGPALGGCRFMAYQSWRAGLDDALRLAAAMTTKCDLAGLAHGGGKTVVVVPPGPERTARHRDAVEDVADVVASLGGSYVTGPDMGTGPDDMAVIHARTGYALCRPISHGGAGHSAPATATGVTAALEAAVAHRGLRLEDCRVGILGWGNVGRRIGEDLAGRVAGLWAADVDDDRRDEASGLATWVTPSELLTTPIDVFVPAAGGGIVDDSLVDGTGCSVIVGPANNQLASDQEADELHRRGVLWIPDALASAGGIIHAVAREELGEDDRTAHARVCAIAESTRIVLDEAAREDVPPQTVVHRISAERRSNMGRSKAR